MSLIRTTRRSGLTLLVLGLAGVAFFWLTDPRFGPAIERGHPIYDPRSWLAIMRGNPSNTIDAANDASVATMVGLAGSASMAAVGMYLMSRRRV